MFRNSIFLARGVILQNRTFLSSPVRAVNTLTLTSGSQFLQNPRHDVSFERRFCLSRRLFADDKRKGTDYIDENPEIQKILRDLYDEPKHEKASIPEGSVDQSGEDIVGSLSYQNFEAFDDAEARIIYDIDEERQLGLKIDQQEKAKTEKRFKGISTKRGKEGVYDLDQLVDLLRKENCCDICAIAVPKENSYVSQLVIATCTSKRHLIAVADFVKKVYKMKMHSKDPVPLFEGRQSKASWIAADMGNIALHLFLQETREHYDLESLWVLGPEFDELSQSVEEAEADELFYGAGPLAGLKPAGAPSEELKSSKNTRNDFAR